MLLFVSWTYCSCFHKTTYSFSNHKHIHRSRNSAVVWWFVPGVSFIIRKSFYSLQTWDTARFICILCNFQMFPVDTNLLTHPVCLFPLSELLRALHPRPQRSGDQGLQDGGRRPRRRGKPHLLQNLCPDRRGEGRMDQQHQVSHVYTLMMMISWKSVLSNPPSSSSCRAAISKDPFYEMLAARKKKVSSLKGL